LVVGQFEVIVLFSANLLLR